MKRVLCFLVVAFAPLLTGCTVDVDGRTGITIDAQGELLGIVAMCDQTVDGFTLYFHHDDESETVTSWESKKPIGGVFTWKLRSGEESLTWKDAETFEPDSLTPGVEYTMYGWTNDNSWSASHVYFTTADLKRLKPGKVLENYYVEKTDDVVTRFVDKTKWVKESCEEVD